ncbi:MAG: efflux RND transporter permease subunit [Myxococcaceae bacterium]
MSAFFIRRPIVAIVLAIITVIAGVVALGGLPIALFPNIVPPQIQLTTTYTGADAITVEQAVATPIEQQMNGVQNMLYLQSTNGSDGTMTVVVTFSVGSNIDTDNVLAQNRYSQAQSSLPQAVLNNGVTIQPSYSFPLIVVSLFSPDKRYDGTFLGNYATINIVDALKRIPGVGNVVLYGSANYAMRVWVNPDLLTRLGLTVNDLAEAVKRQSVVNPAGQIGAEPAPPGQQFTYTVRAQGRLVTAEDFGNVIVRLNPDGSTVRLKDVSRIELGATSYMQEGRYNGQPAGVIAVQQAPGSNALDVVAGVKKTFAELQEKFPPGMAYDVSLDTTLQISEGMHDIVKTLFEAIALVIIVVFIFLQSWRATLIPIIAVPVSLVGTFAVFPLLGFTVNTLSLLGLVLAVGIVVDDAIVVVEAVEHHIEHGLTPRDAAFKAMKEVEGPVIGTALILAAVFVPTVFLGGITGLLYQQFAVTIAVSVLLSAFNALTLSPALSAMLLRPRSTTRGLLGRLGARFNDWFRRMTERYGALSGGLIRKMLIPLALLVGVAVVDVLVGGKLPGGFVPQEDQGYCLLAYQLPNAASLQRTRAVGAKVEEILSKTPGVRSYNVINGLNLLSSNSASYTGTAFVSFKNWSERETPEERVGGILRHLNAAFAAIPEARLVAFPPPAIPGIGTAGGFDVMVQDRSGGSEQFLAENTAKLVQALSKRPEVAGVLPNFAPAVPQLFVNVDKDKVLKQGIPLGSVYDTLQAFLGGMYINQFNRFGRTWNVFLQAESQYRLKPKDLESFYVRNNSGEMVPLSTLVTVENISGPQFTVRFNLFRSAELLGGAKPGFSSGQVMKAVEETAKEVLPAGMGIAWTNMSYQEKAAEGGTAKVFILSLVFVFLILAALYESWSLPFSVLLSTPIAILGAFAGLLMRRFDFDVYGQIGLIMLIGLAAKNAILIVEFAKAELEKGQPLVEAALTGAKLRLRPILMTSFAFILGCVPLWLAAGAGGNSRKILGTVVIMGMLAATGIAIFLVPVLFVFVERLSGHKDGAHKPGGVTPVAPPEGAGGHS